ncbi:hypothetical protein NPIL_554231 [Nephila pilipes]|uniref:Uncharacterized protein n=1 Tax=Nephila pilipes TaxID=299642 RepID=A0A8X6NPJ6_NEPPI|nr:hypothetical protein NPIL_554231 [Nephila pilipes]
MSRKKKLSLQEAFNFLQSLPSESSDALSDDSSDEEFTANNLLEFSSDSYVAYKGLRENISSLEYRSWVTIGLLTKSKEQPKRKGRPNQMAMRKFSVQTRGGKGACLFLQIFAQKIVDVIGPLLFQIGVVANFVL